MPPSETEVLATLSASGPRRFFALAVLVTLGGLMIYLALVTGGMSFLWRVFLAGLGGGVLLVFDHLRRATALKITLTRQEMRDSSGRVLTQIADVRSVSGGTFAFKPSHGFMVRLKTRQPRVWAPGLWWRFGTRLGIGGVTSPAQAKFMSEILTAMIARRDGGLL